MLTALGIKMVSNSAPEYYRYCRSKGAAFGHSARSRNPIKAWNQTKKFLDNFTNYELTLPVEIDLQSIDGEFNQELLKRLKSQFGEPTSSSSRIIHWSFDADYSDDLVLIALDNAKYEKVDDGPVSIKLYFNFYWKNLDSKLLKKYSNAFSHFFKQGHHGKFSIYVSDRVFIQPEFVVPIDTIEILDVFVGELREELPFKFQDKSFISFYTMKLKNGNSKYKAIGYYGENS